MEDFFYISIYIAFFGSIIGSIAYAIVKAIRNPEAAKKAKANYPSDSELIELSIIGEYETMATVGSIFYHRKRLH